MEEEEEYDGEEKFRHVGEENLGAVIKKFDEFDLLKWGFDVRSRVIVGCD